MPLVGAWAQTSGTTATPSCFPNVGPTLGGWFAILFERPDSWSISNANGWTEAFTSANAGDNAVSSLWIRPVTSTDVSNGTGVAVDGPTLNTSAHTRRMLGEFSGWHASAPLDKMATSSVDSNSLTGHTTGTTAAQAAADDDAIAGWRYSFAATTGTPTNSYTKTANTNSPDTLVVAHRALASSAATESTLNISGTSRQSANGVATFKLAIINVVPTADAGPNQPSITEGDMVTLTGAGSTDSDGTIASYAWTQTAGTSVTLSSSTVVGPTFTAPTPATDPEVLTFSLVVTDDDGATSTANTVDITVAAAATGIVVDVIDETGATVIANATISRWDNGAWVAV